MNAESKPVAAQRRPESDLTHIGADGLSRMVDVSAKPETARVAVASGYVTMRAETLAAIRSNALAKGDVLGVARLAGLMAAKRTAELIPLCHSLPLTDVQVTLEPDDGLPGVRCAVTVRTVARTGVEMEAIVAVSIALATVYDMAKAMDRGMVISGVTLDEKAGGRSGRWRRDQADESGEGG